MSYISIFRNMVWLTGVWEEIDFETVSNVAVGEIQQVIQQIILCLRWKNYDLSDKKSDVVYIHRSFWLAWYFIFLAVCVHM